MSALRLVPRTPHRQIALIGALFMLLGAAVLAIGVVQLGDVRSNLRRVDRDFTPAIDKLVTIDREFSAGRDTLLAALDSDDPVEQATLLASATESQSVATDRWAAFRRHVDDLPNLRGLVESVDRDFAALNEQGAALLSGQTPELRSSFDTTFARLRSGLAELLRRFSGAGRQGIGEAATGADDTQRNVLIAFSVVLVVIAVTTVVAVQMTRRRERRDTRRDAERQQQAERDELDARLQRALEMTDEEDAAFDMIEAAMAHSLSGVPADLLVADSPRGHFRRVATTVPDSAGTCPVTAPGECPATNRGKSMEWRGADALESCPFRQRQQLPPTAATCVPVNVSGHATGVICTLGPIGEPIDAAPLGLVELMARKTGERLTLMRAFARSERLASTDPLTGLYNRRSLEQRAEDLIAEGHTFVVAYGDLDHFKLVNDVYGHESGDRALQVFSRVLRDSIRPSDLPGRFGGEEFVVVLPDCPVPDAAAVLERVRIRLANATSRPGVPDFTVSFGLSTPDAGRPLEEVVNEADAALRQAKADGRDRVVLAAPDDGITV